ncbi:MAG: peptidylprolyl isomerase [Thermoproteota archaeon]|nr:peptidylprolyl isomerase [Thermoproteota archaeon]
MTTRYNIITKHGKIQIELFSQVAPKTVANFKKLADSGFYDSLLFHRIVPGFVIQGGDPLSKNHENRSVWGTGGPGSKIDAEFSDLKHSRGMMSMARSHDPNSAGSQFFIVLKDSYFLDGQYSIFGQVVEGIDIVDKIGSTHTDSNDAPLNIDDAKIMKVEVVE